MYICYNCGEAFQHEPVVSDGTTHGKGWTYCTVECYEQINERIAEWLR